MTTVDDDAVKACAELVRRTGATQLEIGYLHDDVPAEDAGWYAHAHYNGSRITTEDHRGPVEAADALARRLLQGARCTHCHGLVTLSSEGVLAYKHATMTDGTKWTAEQAAAAPQCRWRRIGDHWKRGCEVPGNPATGAPTAMKLAAALRAIPGIPPVMTERAERGYYHDFLSPLPTPLLQLVADLTELAASPGTPRDSRPLLRSMAQAVKDGEYDATKEESDAWARSPEGQAAFGELLREAGRDREKHPGRE